MRDLPHRWMVAGLTLAAPLVLPAPLVPPAPLAPAATGFADQQAAGAQNAPDYNRDIRPILAESCFRCHGPDAGTRKRGLRLDTAEGATATLKSGRRAVVPGDVGASELVARIHSADPDTAMPPPAMQHQLTPRDRQALIEWIRAGAQYQPHWAFVPPHAQALPAVQQAAWCRDPLDRFVLARLEVASLAPSPEADRETLLRRVSLALTGLPPTPQETDDFLGDVAAGAYERQVDRLLASPRFGERMAADWLDVARYADTYGYQSDWECRTWPWRDWVINAFNANMRYDQFIRDQVAGDLQPGATQDQRLATAFNRLHRQTNEGGSIDEEFRQEYISDRVQTFGTAFLGLTVECARCHDHKYDPISQADYYSLGAYFGAIDEAGTYAYSTGAVPRPAMRLTTPADEAALAPLRAAVDAAERAAEALATSRRAAFQEWIDRAAGAGVPPEAVPAPVKRYPLDGAIAGPTGKASLLDGDSGPSFDDVPAFARCDPRTLVFWMRCKEAPARATVLHTSRFTIESDQQGYQVMLKDGHLCWEIIHLWPGSAAAIRTRDPVPLERWMQVAVTYDGSSRANGLRIFLDGIPVETSVVQDHLDGPATVHAFQLGFRDRDQGFKGGALDDLQVFDRELSEEQVRELHSPGAIAALLSGASHSEADARAALQLARAVDDQCHAATRALREARAALHARLEPIPLMMVMEESPRPRASFVLTRGQYDQPDVSRPVWPNHALDAVLAMDAESPRNRLGLAQWTTDPRNPLTARVAVNRLWATCFGRGLVGTVENFGLQGEAPTHPELLDALAVDFVREGWDTKALLRRIVLSATFRQSSALTPESAERDPRGALLSRGPALRLSAEALRDQALLAAGLLAERIGGPSVKPWQPAGLWEDAGVSAQAAYVPDSGPNAHRRSVYTYRKRTSPPPNMMAFDAGSGEKCLARRQPTNTPQQALVLMNDPVFLECARAMAALVAREAGEEPQARVVAAFRRLASRQPRAGEVAPLLALYQEQLAAFARDDRAAKAVAGADGDAGTAALTLVCSTLLASDAAVSSR